MRPRPQTAASTPVKGRPDASVGEQILVQQQHTRSGWGFCVKIKRVLWVPFRLLFLPGSGRWLSPLRTYALMLFGARIERPVLIMDGVRVWHPWSLTLGRFCTLGRGVEVYNYAPITVGEQATVSQETYLCTASHDSEDPKMTLIFEPIVIGPQVWVAARCFVGPGVTIGEGAVAGACSVVMKDVLPWTVVAGNPARVIKQRRLGRLTETKMRDTGGMDEVEDQH